MAEKKSGEGATVEELQAQIEALQKALEEARAAAPDAESILADAEAVRERVQEGLQDFQKQIDAHPVPSALLAFGLGFLIGRLLTR
jgi:chromosome segregation ATPase